MANATTVKAWKPEMPARALWLAIAGLLVSQLASGCVTTASFGTPKEKAAAGDVCSVAVCWDKQIAFTPDPVNGGKSTPTLLGCMYVYSTQSGALPVHADGIVIVDLYDPARTAAGGSPVTLEEWRIDRAM